MSRQLSEFKKTLCRYSGQKFQTPKDWFEAFDFLRDVIESAKPGKKIVFLDELPWMDTAKSSFVSALEHFWCGLAFERVCLQHVAQIKAALGIADVRTEAYGWRMASEAGGAQIDLVLVRDDRVVNLCEMKYTNGEYVIDEDYERRLRNKVDAYQRETGTEDTILLTMVTARGLKANAYSACVQKELVAEDLFR